MDRVGLQAPGWCVNKVQVVGEQGSGGGKTCAQKQEGSMVVCETCGQGSESFSTQNAEFLG